MQSGNTDGPRTGGWLRLMFHTRHLQNPPLNQPWLKAKSAF